MKDKLNRQGVEEGFTSVIEALGLDIEDPNIKGTAKRLTKMYIDELFEGLYTEKPNVVSFPNTGENTFLYTKVPFNSTCAHHFQPVQGIAHIMVDYGYSGRVIGLSKFNRIVSYYALRPTLQEDVGNNIVMELCDTLDTVNICVILVGTHGCVTGRGVCASFSKTMTRHFSKGCTSDFKNECLSLFDRG